MFFEDLTQFSEKYSIICRHIFVLPFFWGWSILYHFAIYVAVITLGRGPAFCLDCMNFSTNEREWLQHLHSEWNQIIPCKSAQWHQSVAGEAGNPRAFLNEFEWIQKTFYSLVSMLLNTTSILQGMISRTPQKNAQAWLTLTMLYQFLLLSLFGIPFCKTWSFEISSMLFFQSIL